MNSIAMRFPKGRKKALTLSYDDGVEQDIKLISIMKEYGLKGTFNLNSGEYAPEGKVYEPGTIHRRMSKDMVTKVYKESGFEVAEHTLNHPFISDLPENICNYQICEDRKNLEEQFGCLVRGMAYPYGVFNDMVVECLKNNGIAYARTVWSSCNFEIPRDWLRLRPTCHHNDPKLDELTDRFLNEEPGRNPWLFYLWGHAYEFEEKDNWDRITDFAQKTGNRDEIWYCTNIEVYDYVKAYESLQFSFDAGIVKNSSALTVWFALDGKEFSIAPGEMMVLKNCL